MTSLTACLLILLAIGVLLTPGDCRKGDSDKSKCEVCRSLVKGVQEGLKKTSRLNFAGGDVSWEEEKKLSYATSETRFLEIMEMACKSDSYRCQAMVEEYEESLEIWFFKKRTSNKDLLTWLCINKLKMCCPKNTFGKKCKPCPGGATKPCNGEGTCSGAGDRKGSGMCKCNTGYAGKSCSECSAAYVNTGNETSPVCMSCHKSCSLNCTGVTAGDCDDCKTGWEEENEVCTDVDECKKDNPPCQQSGRYCSNTEGSYRCARCDKACADNCTASGPSACLECASGYTRATEEEPCVDIDECKEDNTNCSVGTYCHNTAGSFSCWSCHSACADGCTAGGADHCVNCSEGYEMENSTCTDVDECKSSPCDEESQVCRNVPGSFDCDCKKGFTRTDGICKKKPEPKEEDDDDDDGDNESDDDAEEEEEFDSTGEPSDEDKDESADQSSEKDEL